MEELNVCVTGAAGQIAYSLLANICNGSVFGARKIRLSLLDIPAAMDALKGVVMELEDCAFEHVVGIVASCDPLEAFAGCDVAVLVGAMPRREGMQRKDLLRANAGIFKSQGEALNKAAKRSVKVLVVGNPANTNALLARHYAPDIPSKNFTALTRLDENRARHQIAHKVGCRVEDVENVVVWGNHSNTQYPDVSSATVRKGTGRENVKSLLGTEYLQGEFLSTVQQRGAAVIAARKLSSAMSAAKAVCDHLRDWINGTPKGRHVSMAVWSDGSYGLPKDVVFSFPCECQNGEWRIVQGLEISDYSRKMLDATARELLDERKEALAIFEQEK